MVVREWLKAWVISYIHLAEGVNGSMEAKVLGQGVGSGSRVGVDRVRMGKGFGREI